MYYKHEHENLFLSKEKNLEIAIGDIKFKDDVIVNLRKQIENLRSLLSTTGCNDSEISDQQYKHRTK